jgi:hypothetical protein
VKHVLCRTPCLREGLGRPYCATLDCRLNEDDGGFRGGCNMVARDVGSRGIGGDVYVSAKESKDDFLSFKARGSWCWYAHKWPRKG